MLELYVMELAGRRLDAELAAAEELALARLQSEAPDELESAVEAVAEADRRIATSARSKPDVIRRALAALRAAMGSDGDSDPEVSGRGIDPAAEDLSHAVFSILDGDDGEYLCRYLSATLPEDELATALSDVLRSMSAAQEIVAAGDQRRVAVLGAGFNWLQSRRIEVQGRSLDGDVAEASFLNHQLHALRVLGQLTYQDMAAIAGITVEDVGRRLALARAIG